MTSKERCHLCIIYAWIMHQWIVNHWIVYCELAQLLWTCIIPWKCMNTSISKISSLDCGFFCILILPANVFLIPRPSEVLQTPKLSILQEFFLNTPENSLSFLYTWPLEFPHAVFFDRQKFFGVKFSWTTVQNKIIKNSACGNSRG